jgi:hypothetical protein
MLCNGLIKRQSPIRRPAVGERPSGGCRFFENKLKFEL